MIAWLSMAVDPTAIPGRISMVMMTLLTLMAMFSGVRQNTPKVWDLKRFYRKSKCVCIVFILSINSSFHSSI